MRSHTFLSIGTYQSLWEPAAVSVFRAHNTLLYHKYGSTGVTRSSEMLVPIYQAKCWLSLYVTLLQTVHICVTRIITISYYRLPQYCVIMGAVDCHVISTVTHLAKSRVQLLQRTVLGTRKSKVLRRITRVYQSLSYAENLTDMKTYLIGTTLLYCSKSLNELWYGLNWLRKCFL